MAYQNIVRLVLAEIVSILSTLTDDKEGRCLRTACFNASKGYFENSILKTKPWPLLSLFVFKSISGRYRDAVPLAASLHLLKTAAEIFDDIEDSDKESAVLSQYGLSGSVNIGTTLIMLAENAVLRLLNTGIDKDTVLRILGLINTAYTTACVGQNMEFYYGSDINITEDTYFKAIEMKSAASLRCACAGGAILSGASNEIINYFGDFGRNIGIAAQIANDISGIVKEKDIIQMKITLPVIFALENGNKLEKKQLNNYYKKQNTADSHETIKNILFRCGAIYYATIQMDLYKQSAADILVNIKEAGIKTKSLEIFLK